MSGFMQHEDFERLWRNRDELDPETRAQLDEFVKKDRLARDFVKDGSDLRSLLLQMDDEKAASDFSYRMGIYAKNHLGPEQTVAERPWFRWSAVSAGLVSGALMMMFLLGGPESLTTPAFQGTGMLAQPTVVDEATPAVVPTLEELAVISDSTAGDQDTVLSRSSHPVPNFELQQVSTSE